MSSDIHTIMELRTYLRKAKRAPIPVFDHFLEDVEDFVKCRVEAEKCHKKMRHRAKNKRAALPLDWPDIKRILNKDVETPEESLMTQVTRECLSEVDQVVRDLRKVLVRRRENVQLGRVQQVDSHCLRRLSRQPGRNAAEKAGGRQRILAVVRQESFDTLENRVLKDFMARVDILSREYLKRNEYKFKNVEIVKKVRRLFSLCAETLRDPALEAVQDLAELPHPNYVLRQERRYSKIWKSYCRVIRHAHIAELLWQRRDELTDTLVKLIDEVPRQSDPRARFHCPLWFPPIDGKHVLIEEPFYENEYAESSVHPDVLSKTDGDFIIDLNRPPRDLMIYGRHPNAKPYLQDYGKPSVEDRHGSNHYFLNEILKSCVNQEALPQSSIIGKLRDYFEQLYALVGGNRWFILIPDDWNALWQEAIIEAVPRSRNNVTLLWRSVVAAIGAMPKIIGAVAGDEVAVLDVRKDGSALASKLTLAATEDGRLVPQRKSFNRGKTLDKYRVFQLNERHSDNLEKAFLEKGTRYFDWQGDAAGVLSFLTECRHIVLVAEDESVWPRELIQRAVVSDGHTVLEKGAAFFIHCLAEGKIPYFDELEALSLIVQTPDEQVKDKTLVEAVEQFPGGSTKAEHITDAAFLLPDSKFVDFYLCMGDYSSDAPLKIKRHEFGAPLPDGHSLHLSAVMTPGQGMAVVSVASDFLRDSIKLDFLSGMTDSPKTATDIEKEMERSFPPDSPDVIADQDLWMKIADFVRAWYLQPTKSPDGSWFYKPEDLYPQNMPLPPGIKPIERLRRKNVFGNDPSRRYPSEGNFPLLFRALCKAYDKTRPSSDASSRYAQIVRLIAWTYQSDNPEFDVVRARTVKRIVKYSQGVLPAKPLPQEYTLCANLCERPDEWALLWNAVTVRLQQHGADAGSVEEDLRLLYNLLQFHPTFLRDTPDITTETCRVPMRDLIFWYPRCNLNGPNGAKKIGYVLKCILFLLRRRRFDGKVFATEHRDGELYLEIKQCLSFPPRAISKRPLHRTVCDYLDGHGTIDGLPID
ncbi:MAG: DUF2357 domain-containing protein [Kiritimatiellia bacterium]